MEDVEDYPTELFSLLKNLGKGGTKENKLAVA